MEHSGHLTGHQAARGSVALKDGTAQAAQRVFFQLHLIGTGLFLPDIFPAHPVFQNTDGGAADAAGHDGVTVLGPEEGRFVVFVDGALLAHQQAGAHLSTAGPQRKGLPAGGHRQCRPPR